MWQELHCFEALQGAEAIAIHNRQEALQKLVDEQREREATLQARYEELTRTQRTLEETLRAQQ